MSYTRIGEKSKNTEGIIPRVNSIQVWKSPFGSWFHCKTLYLIYFEASAFMAAVCGSERKIGSTVSMISPDTSKKLRLFSSGNWAVVDVFGILKSCYILAEVRDCLLHSGIICQQRFRFGKNERLILVK